MRLFEFTDATALKPGDEVDYSNLKLDKVDEFIRKNCSDYLVAMQQAGELIYRGTDNKSTIFFGHSREHRESISNFPVRVWNQINQYMIDKDFKAIRSNSIFAIGNYYAASEFGDYTVAIFPLNSAKFTYTTDQRDLPMTLVSYFRNSWSADEEPYSDMTPDTIDSFLKSVHFSNLDFEQAILSGNEIMISGSYVAIKANKQKSTYDPLNELLENLLNPNPSKPKINKNILQQIQKDPFSIKYFEIQAEIEQLTAVRSDGTAIQFIKNPSIKVQMAAIKNDITALSYIENPVPEIINFAKKLDPNAEHYLSKGDE